MGKRAKLRIHYHKINERDNPRQRAAYWHYMRRFWHMYRVYPDGTERNIGEWHIESIAKKHPGGDLLSTRFHIGNSGSETPWDGHLILFGIGFYWGYSRGRRLANWLTRCTGYKYDSRDWTLRISDNRLWWEIANHSDMCDITRGEKAKRRQKNKTAKRRRGYLSWRRGSINLSIPEMIWGPNKYTYKIVDGFATMLTFEDGEYPVIIDLQHQYFGRTKVPLERQVRTWHLEVDAPGGIPTHVDHSGGWKGDRTHGFGVRFDNPRPAEWKIDAEAAVRAWVLNERARTGFRKPDPLD